ncbi:proteasome assembly chaperone 3-like [Asterias rubens]|uniref:proteasome assembly chaperone 3-like n=1 Tax=Asterias rubens TaxID=7604 RepID=UPI001454EA86|nr:proteasome assembly chaperone 3-like [Asterias rubens]
MAGDDLPRTKQGAAVIDGVHTDVVCSAFSDRIFVMITQYEKMGTLVHITPDTTPADTRQGNFTTRVLLGNDEPVTHVFAKNIASKICLAPDSKPILLSIALKEHSPALLKSLQDLVMQYRVW